MKKATALLLAIITIISLTATAASETVKKTVSGKYLDGISEISYVSSILIEDTVIDEYAMTDGVVEIYDAVELWKSKSKNWDKTIAVFRKAFTDAGFEEYENKDSYGDKAYIFMNDTEFFYIFGKTESKSAMNEDGVVFIQYYKFYETAPSSWATDEVNSAIKEGLVPSDLKYGYQRNITREQMASMIKILLDKIYKGKNSSSGVSFTDTDNSDVLYAAALGIIKGYEQSDGSFMFKPQNTLKRAEAAVIVNRIAELCGAKVSGFETEAKFLDTSSHWCRKELGYPVHTGIVKGTSATKFSPENSLTVEQAIIIIYRTYKALTK